VQVGPYLRISQLSPQLRARSYTGEGFARSIRTVNPVYDYLLWLACPVYLFLRTSPGSSTRDRAGQTMTARYCHAWRRGDY
jgi:hypothetical protein